MTASAFPLQWPSGVKRTEPNLRKRAKFSKSGDALTVATGRERLLNELGRLRDDLGYYAGGIVISAMVELRRDGLPYSGQREPADPGVAVYFYLRKRWYCLPCDRWDRVADNMAAIAGHIEATRTIERYGVGSVEQAFTGFAYLPRPSWWGDLGLKARPSTLDEAEAAWRRMVKEHHPDRGGSVEIAARANQAISEARKEMAG